MFWSVRTSGCWDVVLEYQDMDVLECQDIWMLGCCFGVSGHLDVGMLFWSMTWMFWSVRTSGCWDVILEYQDMDVLECQDVWMLGCCFGVSEHGCFGVSGHLDVGILFWSIRTWMFWSVRTSGCWDVVLECQDIWMLFWIVRTSGCWDVVLEYNDMDVLECQNIWMLGCCFGVSGYGCF